MPGIARKLDTKFVFIPAVAILSLQGFYFLDKLDILVDEPIVLFGPFPVIGIEEIVIMGILHHHSSSSHRLVPRSLLHYPRAT